MLKSRQEPPEWVHTGGGDSPVAESIAYSVDNGARVVNLSLSALNVLPATQAAIEYANQNNVVVIASSGNSGNGIPNYPASDPSVITVGAITINDLRAGFSNFGAHLDLVVPSPSIHTTNRNSDNSYDSVFGGTSAAAPHVVGLVALMLSVNPDLTPEEVRTAMTENADDFGDPGFDVFYGHGRINVGATIKAIAPLVGDINLDGQINLLDVAPFVELLQSGMFQNEGDINRDGVVDLLDVSGFVDLLSS